MAGMLCIDVQDATRAPVRATVRFCRGDTYALVVGLGPAIGVEGRMRGTAPSGAPLVDWARSTLRARRSLAQRYLSTPSKCHLSCCL